MFRALALRQRKWTTKGSRSKRKLRNSDHTKLLRLYFPTDAAPLFSKALFYWNPVPK